MYKYIYIYVLYMYIRVEGQSSRCPGRRGAPPRGAPRGLRTKGTPHGSILSVKGKESFAVRVLCLRLDKFLCDILQTPSRFYRAI